MNVNQPSGAFGRRGRELRAPAVQTERTAKPARATGHATPVLVGLTCLLLSVAAAIFWTVAGVEQLNAEAARTEQRVVDIVNQPVRHLPRSGPVDLFSPGWFHPGATKPDFDNVDIRTSQELPYQGYVSSDLNPSEMFVGSDLEFNSMTKYFYADRTLPKKRLSQAEMLEINRLYRVIGHDQSATLMQWLTTIGLAAVGICLGYALFQVAGRSRRSAMVLPGET
ncbi:MAG: hypothetical protein J0I79_29935 [Mesorhizobium sp.]|uniref:hypothetical protein n=1 Tax=Mesorhizobium sp. TaxID=1871066 RepID=UPI001AC8C1D6|nr:hypothetical protein [Mesorhizobium sp.]MBN9222181.1 hypothetical protein [Mesorhizobium sp.]